MKRSLAAALGIVLCLASVADGGHSHGNSGPSSVGASVGSSAPSGSPGSQGASSIGTGYGYWGYKKSGSRFLNPGQEYTYDVFNYCAVQQPGLVSLGQLRVDGSFTYTIYIDHAQGNLQRCMIPFGFRFESPLDDPRERPLRRDYSPQGP